MTWWPFHRQSEKPPADPEKWTLRRFEGAETNRTNQNNWRGAHDQSINQDIGFGLETLRARCHYESENNPVIKGMINTYCNHLIGPVGPALQVQSADIAYNAMLENAFRIFAEFADIRGTSLAEIIRVWVRNLFLDGEFLALETSNDLTDSPIRFCLQTIAPRRLNNLFVNYPIDGTQIFMGVEADAAGRVKQYHILDEKIVSGVMVTGFQTITIPASAAHHCFVREEPDQLRGVPWLASALPVIADMRAYDRAVLKAAHNAAKFASIMQTSNPNIEHEEIPGGAAMDIKEDAIQAIPPGWSLQQMTPQQPMTEYPAYRAERHRDIGRVVSMPLMILDLNSANHSYSGGRIDMQVYGSELEDKEGWLERVILNKLVWRVEQEARLSVGLGARPADARLSWTWNQLPHVDPLKEAMGERVELENGTLPFSVACARKGLDPEKVIEMRKADNEKLAAAGLPPVLVAATATVASIAAADQSGGDNPNAKSA